MFTGFLVAFLFLLVSNAINLYTSARNRVSGRIFSLRSSEAIRGGVRAGLLPQLSQSLCRSRTRAILAANKIKSLGLKGVVLTTMVLGYFFLCLCLVFLLAAIANKSRVLYKLAWWANAHALCLVSYFATYTIKGCIKSNHAADNTTPSRALMSVLDWLHLIVHFFSAICFAATMISTILMPIVVLFFCMGAICTIMFVIATVTSVKTNRIMTTLIKQNAKKIQEQRQLKADAPDNEARHGAILGQTRRLRTSRIHVTLMALFTGMAAGGFTYHAIHRAPTMMLSYKDVEIKLVEVTTTTNNTLTSSPKK